MYTKPQMVEIYIPISINPQRGKDERTKSPILSSILHIYSNIPSVISLYVEGGMRGEKKLPLDDQFVELIEQLTQRNSYHK